MEIDRDKKRLNTISFPLPTPRGSLLYCFEQLRVERGHAETTKHGAVGWGWVGHSFRAELPGNRSLKIVSEAEFGSSIAQNEEGKNFFHIWTFNLYFFLFFLPFSFFPFFFPFPFFLASLFLFFPQLPFFLVCPFSPCCNHRSHLVLDVLGWGRAIDFLVVCQKQAGNLKSLYQLPENVPHVGHDKFPCSFLALELNRPLSHITD